MNWAGALQFLKIAGCGFIATAFVIAIVAAIAYHLAPDLRADHRGPR